MTQMTYDDFTLPSQLPSSGGGGYPSFAQLSGRLLHILPRGRQDNVVTAKQSTPHTRLTCDVTFLDGPAIPAIIDQTGGQEPLTPPIGPGQVMRDMFMSQKWFVSRLGDKVGVPGFPGIVGVLATETVKGNPMWRLSDPTPEQLAQVKQWFAWRMQQGDAAYYRPDPVQATPAAAPNPFAQQAPAQPDGAVVPANPFASTQPASPAPAQPQQPVPPAAPLAPQPGPETPPWLR